jgi:hypothetical protein
LWKTPIVAARSAAPEDAELRLVEWVTVTRDRDTRVRAAVEADVSRHGSRHLTCSAKCLLSGGGSGI